MVAQCCLGGDGISKNKEGAWGVEYNYLNTSGQGTSGFITQGSKPETLEQARANALAQINDFDNAVNRYRSVRLTEDGQYRRNLDDQPYDAPLSLETRGKMFLNMYGLGSVSTSPVNVIAQGGQAAKTGGELSKIFLRTNSQLQKKFVKHGADFGVFGKWNPAKNAEFSAAIHQHVNSIEVRMINGTYQGKAVIHYVNPSTGLNVISSPTGSFISGWKLNPAQLNNVLTRGSL